jgi:asparagine synthase (glutamine-hydrolysing)
MCGIAGILASTPTGRPRLAELEAMGRALNHRGPDESGCFLAEEIGFSHTRLSIIDLEGGKQPMHGECDPSLTVVFNGEIFNHVELRDELERRGHRFRTRSDTEVILHAYEEHGLDFVRHFNGQWAIALWDGKRRRLVLARDRVGVRPLFYAQTGDRLIFASEVKALARAGFELALDPRGIAQVLCFWGALDPRTPYRGVASVPPGHVAVVEGGRISLRRTWDWEFPPAGDAFTDRPIEDVAEEVRALLVDAVRLRLRSDVPVGAYLSGGLDSSVITAIIKRHTDTPLRTFSVTFEDPEFDESEYQDEVIRHLDTNHTSVRCTRAGVARCFPRAVWHAETPLVRTAPAPLMMLSETVRAHGYKVVLTGEGADEVFGGYDLFKEALVRRFWARRPDSRLRPALLRRLYPYLVTSPTTAPAYAQSFFGQGMQRPEDPLFAHGPRFVTTQRAWRFFSRDLRGELAGWDPREELLAQLPPELATWAPLCRDQYVEAHTLLSGYLLSAQGDRMAMANSVEGRFPFLDYRVIGLANGLPALLKVLGLKEKFILRKAAASLLPPAVAARPKQPYRAPDSASFFVDGRPASYVAELLSPERLRARGYFDVGAVAKLEEKCRTGRAAGAADNMAFVGILSTMLADEMLVRGTAWSDLAADARPRRHAEGSR